MITRRSCSKFYDVVITLAAEAYFHIESTMQVCVSIKANEMLADVRRHLKKHGQVTEKPSEVTNELNVTSSPVAQKAVNPIQQTALRQSHRSESN